MQRYTEALRLLHALSLSVLATDAHGSITFANEAAIEMFGRPAEDLVGRDVTELVGLDVDGAGGALVLAEVFGGTRWQGDLAVRRRADDTIVAAVMAAPVREPLGSVVGAIISLEDMTDIRTAEAEAAASEQRLRLAHAAAELGTWHWSALDDSNVWDEQMHRIYGLPPGGFDGSWDAWVGSIHPEDRADAISIVEKAMAELSTYILRHRILRPDGSVRWIEAFGKVLVGPDATPAGTIGCVQDVTERVQMQHRQEDAAARALLLQQVTADFSRAWTPEQVSSVLATSLERVQALVGDDDPPSKEDAQLLDTLASQGSIAAERAELFRRTTEISEELQFSLAASPLPELEGFEVAAYYAPGGDNLEHVGGDWYDAIATPTGELVLVVGDVMGRGVGAATTMIHVRAGIRGLLTVEHSPAALLTAADRMMARDAPLQFVTAAVALLDPHTSSFELSNAGHVPLLLVCPEGTATVIGHGSGAPLGVLSSLERESERESERVSLAPGCTVVMVTDGVVESRDHDIDEGIERLRRRAAELAGAPLADLVAGVAALADERLLDDVTVLAARLRRRS